MIVTSTSERYSYTYRDLARMPRRPERSHKGTFGTLLIVGGSVGMAGAAYLAAKAAYRTGCGLVRILSAPENLAVYQALIPEATVTVYDRDTLADTVKAAASYADAIVLGVGLGNSDAASSIVRCVLESTKVPTVIDADGLNITARDAELKAMIPHGSILTPHPMEMSRLTGLPVGTLLEDIPGHCERFARERGVICLLKDHNTAVSDGERTVINRTGNSGIATGGSGDVLAGIVGSLLAQGASPFDSAALGAFIHGAAGDIAARELSEYSVMASDLIDALPKVLRSVPKDRK